MSGLYYTHFSLVCLSVWLSLSSPPLQTVTYLPDADKPTKYTWLRGRGCLFSWKLEEWPPIWLVVGSIPKIGNVCFSISGSGSISLVFCDTQRSCGWWKSGIWGIILTHTHTHPSDTALVVQSVRAKRCKARPNRRRFMPRSGRILSVD